jgi:4-amino-4-deoxy-L-arabinose transferase-like glycosyltransferase
LTGAVFFSVAGFFHEYYLSILGAPLAVLVAGGAAQLASLGRSRPWLAAGLLLAGGGLTLAYQILTAAALANITGWSVLAGLVFLLGAALLILGGPRSKRGMTGAADTGARVSSRTLGGFSTPGAALALVALLVIPGVWSFLTAQNASSNQSLPSAYSGAAGTGGARGAGFAGNAAPQDSLQNSLAGINLNQQLLVFLQENTQNQRYLMAVPSSMQGADYVLATGRPVLYLGGFNGQDPVLTLDEFQALLSNGELRYVFTGGESRGGVGGEGGNAAITRWVQNSCSAVTGFETQTRNAGAPDGTSGGTGSFPVGGNFNMALYDCGR